MPVPPDSAGYLSSPELLVDLLRGRLAQLDVHDMDGTNMRKAAVLLPLVVQPGEPLVLFTVRTEDMPTHKGQVSFPGGSAEPGDADLLATAVRETHEEIGIEPAEVHILGRMDALPTISSFMVTPFVGVVPANKARVRSVGEVARILEVPLTHLLASASRYPDVNTGHWRYPWDGHEIWGATGRILTQFLTLLGHVDPFEDDVRVFRALTDPDDKLCFLELMRTLHLEGRTATDHVRRSPSAATPGVRALIFGSGA